MLNDSVVLSTVLGTVVSLVDICICDVGAPVVGIMVSTPLVGDSALETDAVRIVVS